MPSIYFVFRHENKDKFSRFASFQLYSYQPVVTYTKEFRSYLILNKDICGKIRRTDAYNIVLSIENYHVFDGQIRLINYTKTCTI